MKVVQTRVFLKAIKKLNKKQKQILDNEVKKIINKPSLGDAKKGDLKGVNVHKFKMGVQLYLLAYTFKNEQLILTLLALGSHENFYRDLKQK